MSATLQLNAGLASGPPGLTSSMRQHHFFVLTRLLDRFNSTASDQHPISWASPVHN